MASIQFVGLPAQAKGYLIKYGFIPRVDGSGADWYVVMTNMRSKTRMRVQFTVRDCAMAMQKVEELVRSL